MHDNDDQLDADTDGVGDACDNCDTEQNSDQYDNDANGGDGIGDACDHCVDRDGDELGDPDSVTPMSCPEDNCPFRFNPPPTPGAEQVDADNDGFGDACDLCPTMPDTGADRDADGRGDECDNCPDAPNTDQLDTGGRPDVGDACDCVGLDAIPAPAGVLEVRDLTEVNEGLPAASGFQQFSLDVFGRVAASLQGVVYAGNGPESMQRVGDGFEPALDPGGSYLAFESIADFAGQNADSSLELFLWKKQIDGFRLIRQVTDNAGARCYSRVPQFSRFGRRMVYISNCDPVGLNPDGNTEIFLFDRRRETISQLTNTTECNNGLLDVSETGAPSISLNGRKVAFHSDCPLTPDAPTSLVSVYVLRTDTGAVVRLPNCPTCRQSYNPEVSPEGRYVVYYSEGRERDDATLNVYLRWAYLGSTGMSASGLCPPIVPDAVSERVIQKAFPADGDYGNDRIIFPGTFDPLEENGVGARQIFLTRPRTGETRQVTHLTSGNALSPQLDWGGRYGAYVLRGRLLRFTVTP